MLSSNRKEQRLLRNVEYDMRRQLGNQRFALVFDVSRFFFRFYDAEMIITC